MARLRIPGCLEGRGPTEERPEEGGGSGEAWGVQSGAGGALGRPGEDDTDAVCRGKPRRPPSGRAAERDCRGLQVRAQQGVLSTAGRRWGRGDTTRAREAARPRPRTAGLGLSSPHSGGWPVNCCGDLRCFHKQERYHLRFGPSVAMSPTNQPKRYNFSNGHVSGAAQTPQHLYVAVKSSPLGIRV